MFPTGTSSQRPEEDRFLREGYAMQRIGVLFPREPHPNHGDEQVFPWEPIAIIAIGVGFPWEVVRLV